MREGGREGCIPPPSPHRSIFSHSLPRPASNPHPLPPGPPFPPNPPQDGTLLDSSSRVLPSSVAAIQAALAAGVTVFLATGKARPAAIRAMQAVGLAGEGLVVSNSGPGIFLQGGRAGVSGGWSRNGVQRIRESLAGLHRLGLCILFWMSS